MHESATAFIVDDETGARESVAALVESMGLTSKCFVSGKDLHRARTLASGLRRAAQGC